MYNTCIGRAQARLKFDKKCVMFHVRHHLCFFKLTAHTWKLMWKYPVDHRLQTRWILMHYANVIRGFDVFHVNHSDKNAKFRVLSLDNINGEF